MAIQRHHLATLTFKGPRFDDHGLDLSVLPELLAYRKLVVETAKALWRRQNSDRERLPKGFEENISIKFYTLEPGSTAVPLERVYESEESGLPVEIGDEVEMAVGIIEDTMSAAEREDSPPSSLPGEIVPLFEEFGKTLSVDEVIEVVVNKERPPVRYSSSTRERIGQWVEKTYEDTIDISGEVRLADLDGSQFALRLDSGAKVPGRFQSGQEATITQALQDHQTRRLRIRGRGEFLHKDASLKRIIAIESLDLRNGIEEPVSEGDSPLWRVISQIGAEISNERWRELPENLSETIDKTLYGSDDSA